MTPKEAYGHAKKHGSSNKTREIACQDSAYAYYYALEVDKCPREDTRETACKDPQYAYYYAKNVDKCPHEETRRAVCFSSGFAYLYARDIDKCPTEETWLAIKGSIYEEEYKEMFNELFKD